MLAQFNKAQEGPIARVKFRFTITTNSSLPSLFMRTNYFAIVGHVTGLCVQ